MAKTSLEAMTCRFLSDASHFEYSLLDSRGVISVNNDLQPSLYSHYPMAAWQTSGTITMVPGGQRAADHFKAQSPSRGNPKADHYEAQSHFWVLGSLPQ